MKGWLLTEGKSFTDDEEKAKDGQDEKDADEIRNDEDTGEDHEDAKLQVLLRNLLDNNDLPG